MVAPREGSPLTFNSIEDFSVGTFKQMATYERSADVRQVRVTGCCLLASAGRCVCVCHMLVGSPCCAALLTPALLPPLLLCQAVALLLPRFARHIPPSQRAALLPGLVRSLAGDSHFNVRCEVPQLLVNLLAADSSSSDSSAPHPAATAAGQVSGSSGTSSSSSSAGGGGLHQLLGKGAAGAAGTADSVKGGARVRVPPHSRVEETWGPEELRMLW